MIFEKDFVITDSSQPVIHIAPPPMRMSLHDVANNNAELGIFYWDKKEFKFEGNAHESAKVFIDYCKQVAEDYIKDNFIEKEKVKEVIENIESHGTPYFIDRRDLLKELEIND